MPLARWAWNTSPKAALAGLTPYEVIVGFPPRTPLSWLTLPASEAVAAEHYVRELLEAMEKVHNLVRRAQDRREEELRRRAAVGPAPRRLEVGEHVLVRRPPLLQPEGVSRKLQARQRMDVYRVIKTIGDADYVLGDVVSGREVTAFKQPIHADRLVPLDVQELTEPITEDRRLTIEGTVGHITKMSLDGRVLVEMGARPRELEFAQRFKKLGATVAAERGVWLDLSKFAYSWH